MIHRENGELVAECDCCGTEFPGGTLEWDAFIADLKREGWRIKKDGETWEHYCEECAG